MTLRCLYIVCGVALLTSCGHGGDVAVPRRTAYPRVALADTAMVTADSVPVRFDVSAAARVSHPAPGWLDVAYPMYGATVHVTFTTVTAATVDAVRVNRMERLMLNMGDNPGQRHEFVNDAGYDVLAVLCDAGSTPVQFLATDGESMVVSGAVSFADPRAAAATDSVAPMVAAIYDDVMRSLYTLGQP